jgi:hypothetical protein
MGLCDCPWVTRSCSVRAFQQPEGYFKLRNRFSTQNFWQQRRPLPAARETWARVWTNEGRVWSRGARRIGSESGSTSNYQYSRTIINNRGIALREVLLGCPYLKCGTCVGMLWWLRSIRNASAPEIKVCALGARDKRASVTSDPGSAIVLNTPHTYSQPQGI